MSQEDYLYLILTLLVIFLAGFSIGFIIGADVADLSGKRED